MSYLRHAPGRGQTPQDRAIPGRTEEMVENRAGGYVFPVTPMTQFRRWLILGSEGGTYYASEREATLENVAVLDKVDPMHAITVLVEISLSGRAPKQDQILYALAYFTQHPDVKVRRYVYTNLPRVCRTATHLFQFVSYLDDQRSPDSHWGRGLRRAVGLWYAQDVNKVAYQVVKYRQRHGYTHRDLLRLAHPSNSTSSGNPEVGGITAAHARLYDWVCGRLVKGKDLPAIVRGYRRAQRKKNKPKLPELIQQYGLPWECIEDEDLNRPEVLDALAGGRPGDKHAMPMGALIRQLPRLTRAGLLKPMGGRTQDIVGMLGDSTFLRQDRIHPIQLLVAQMTYRSGQSLRGSSTWTPVPEIVEALSDAFYLAFRSVEPTGLRHLLAVDVSGSMTGNSVMGVPGFSPRMGAAAMALVQANVGDPYHMVAFSADTGLYRKAVEEQELRHHQLYGVSASRWVGYGSTESYFQDPESWAIRPLDISPRQRIDGAMETMRTTQAGGTDAALPMLYAKDNELEVDVFVVLTDNESWAGKIHVTQALKAYRKESGIHARLAVVAMTATNYSVADPDDAGQLDCVGFDAATPQIISDFARGSI